MKLFEDQGIGGQFAFLDRAVIVAVEGFAQDFVGLALQGIQFFDRIDFSYQRNRGQQFLAVQGVEPPFVALDVVAQRRAALAEHREQLAPVEGQARGELADYYPVHSARGELHRRMGRFSDAAVAYRRALELVSQEPERRFLERRLTELNSRL